MLVNGVRGDKKDKESKYILYKTVFYIKTK